MNKTILNELKKVSATTIEFDENSTKIFIPRTVKINKGSLQKGVVYRLKLSEFITNPNDTSTLASNWNAGKVPAHSEYFAEIIDKLANMIKINGVAVEDQSDNFYGWLPVDFVEVVERV